ncbi:MAG: STAS domain-containing protein [bacterium]
MQVKTNEYGVAVYLTPDGPLVEENLPAFEQTVSAAREREGSQLVVDMKHVHTLDSKGLEFLHDLSIELREAGGSLRLASPNALCAEILSLTDLDQTIPVFADIESAGRSFL